MATKKKTVSKAKPPALHSKQVDESKPLEEAVTPKADAVTTMDSWKGSGTGCKECGHGEGKHYGSPNRWCNTSGCECLAFKA